MRIRKHAKISPLLYTSSSLQHGTVLQTTVCHLNQSPWDIVTFSPPHTHSFPATTPPPPPPLHHQGFIRNRFLEDEDDSFLGNGSFGDSIGAEESVLSTKLSFNDNANEMRDCAYPDADVAVKLEPPVEEDEIFCSKIDSKGWQCHRIAKSGHTFCEHHLSREFDKSIEHGGRRGRPKKAKDPNGYYYYSGFGPRWGKRRGAAFSSCSNNGSSGNGEGGEVLETSSRIGCGESDYMEEEEEEENGEDEGCGGGKKRARKPIKARSLKSLM